MSICIAAMSSTNISTNLLVMLLIHSLLIKGSYSTKFTIINKCNITIIPGIFNGAVGTSLISNTGFSLRSGESKVLTPPLSWSGSLWGRTYCSHNSNGKLSCLTGNCASSTIECDGVNASPPATIANFNLSTTSHGFDFFHVSVVNGYNLPMIVEPQVGNGVGDCMTAGCTVHLKKMCPPELKVMSGGDCIGCSSACQPLSKYCKEFFAKACSHAKTIQSVCPSTDYLITFCTTSTSRTKPSKDKNPTMVDNSEDQKKGSTKDKIEKLLAIVGVGIVVVVIVITISCACACNKDGCYFMFDLGARIKAKLPSHLFTRN